MHTPPQTSDLDPSPPPGRGSGRWPVWLLLAGLAGVYLYSFWPRHSDVPWENDLPQALARARETGQPLLIEFQADRCAPCRRMKRDVFPRSDVARALQGWVPVQVDVDAQPGVSEQYGVHALPTFLVLASDGRELSRTEGSMTAEQFIAFVADAGVDPRGQATRLSP